MRSRQRDFDFIIKAESESESVESLSKKVLYALTIQRLKKKKPSIWFVWGDSGEAKSSTGLHLEDFILECFELDLINYVDDVNVYTPVEYPKKIKAILEEKRLKNVHVIAMHEAREVIRASLWSTFIVQAVGDINAMSRSIKRLCIIIISQFIKDIANKIRYTINYYAESYRPITGGKAKLYISVLWKDDRDLERPKLRKRGLKGKVVLPNGRYRIWKPTYLELPLPRRDVLKEFEKSDIESKRILLSRKINKLIKEIEKETGGNENEKLDRIVDYYTRNDDLLNTIGKRTKRGFTFNKDITKMFDLSPAEKTELVNRIKMKLKQDNIIKEQEVENEQIRIN